MPSVYGQVYGATAGGGGDAATPTISVADGGDGTATVTISGLTSELATVEYFQPGGSWLTLGTRSGNGTVAGAITGAPGAFWFVCTADDDGDQELSEPVLVQITNAAVGITPEGWLSLELYNLQESLVASDCWRAIVALPDSTWPAVKTLADAGTADAAAARAKVISERTDDEDDDEDPPRCIIRHLTSAEAERFGTSGFSAQGQLLLLVELPIPTELAGNTKAHLYDFTNKVGRLIREIGEASATGGARAAIDQVQRGTMGQIDPKDVRGSGLRCAEFVITVEGPFS